MAVTSIWLCLFISLVSSILLYTLCSLHISEYMLILYIVYVGLVILVPVGVYFWHKNSSKYGENNIQLGMYHLNTNL